MPTLVPIWLYGNTLALALALASPRLLYLSKRFSIFPVVDERFEVDRFDALGVATHALVRIQTLQRSQRPAAIAEFAIVISTKCCSSGWCEVNRWST